VAETTVLTSRGRAMDERVGRRSVQRKRQRDLGWHSKFGVKKNLTACAAFASTTRNLTYLRKTKPRLT
jgi:hypothetical protein